MVYWQSKEIVKISIHPVIILNFDWCKQIMWQGISFELLPCPVDYYPAQWTITLMKHFGAFPHVLRDFSSIFVTLLRNISVGSLAFLFIAMQESCPKNNVQQSELKNYAQFFRYLPKRDGVYTKTNIDWSLGH